MVIFSVFKTGDNANPSAAVAQVEDQGNGVETPVAESVLTENGADEPDKKKSKRERKEERREKSSNKKEKKDKRKAESNGTDESEKKSKRSKEVDGSKKKSKKRKRNDENDETDETVAKKSKKEATPEPGTYSNFSSRRSSKKRLNYKSGIQYNKGQVYLSQ